MLYEVITLDAAAAPPAPAVIRPRAPASAGARIPVAEARHVDGRHEFERHHLHQRNRHLGFRFLVADFGGGGRNNFV